MPLGLLKSHLDQQCQSPERASSLNPATPIASTSKMLPCCRKSNTARVENSAQKTTFYSACDGLPKLCKKHRYCYTGTLKGKREACASLKGIAWMLRAPHFKEPCGSEGCSATLFSSAVCRKGIWPKLQTIMYSSSHFLSCTWDYLAEGLEKLI